MNSLMSPSDMREAVYRTVNEHINIAVYDAVQRAVHLAVYDAVHRSVQLTVFDAMDEAVDDAGWPWGAHKSDHPDLDKFINEIEQNWSVA